MSQDEISLKEIVQVLGKRKKFIIGGTLICVLIAGGVSFLMPKTYQSSLMLKIGQIYLPPDTTKKDVELIEKASLLAEEIGSGALLEKVWMKSKEDIPERKRLKAQMEAEIFEKGTLPLIKVYCQSRDPLEAFKLLTGVGEMIIDCHSHKYEANRRALEVLIDNLQEKIKATEKVITAQSQYRQEVLKFSQEGENSLDEFRNKLSKLQSSQVTPMELLFLQTSSLNENRLITELNQIQAELMISIEENQKMIADYRDTIATLELRLALSTPTKVIKPSTLHTAPVRPNKKLITIIAAVLGLLFSTSFVFLDESMKG